MALRWYTVVTETTDPRRLASWWAEALDWDTVYEADDEVVIVPKWAQEQAKTTPFHQQGAGLVFVKVEHEKSGKNRLHIDLAPHTSDDRDAEIQRLIDLGATRIEVGQKPEHTWTVLADPDGNEFCVLSSREF